MLYSMAEKAVIYDFDGTWTDTEAEMRPVLDGIKNFLVQATGMHMNDIMEIWELIEKKYTTNHEIFGVRGCSARSDVITAPMSSSVVQLYAQILVEVLRILVGDRTDFTLIERMNKAFEGVIPNVFGFQYNRNVGAFADGLMSHFLHKPGIRPTAVFREGLEDHLKFALDRGFEMSVVSNSAIVMVRNRIRSDFKIFELVKRMEAKDGRRVIGNAGKDKVFPDWDDKISFGGSLTFKGLPKRVRITKYGLQRPIYTRRKLYFDAMERLEFTRAWHRFVIGDCMENDLLLPHIMRSEVGLMDHPLVPEHERRWAEGAYGARVLRSFEDATAMLEKV